MPDGFLQTTLCYLVCGERYLMMHRTKKENDVNKEKWVGIGGKCLPGEDAVTCVKREVQEETGLILQTPVQRGVVDFYSPPWPAERMHLFTCAQGDYTGETQNLPPCREGELRWIPIRDVPRLPIWEGDKIFLRLIEQNEPFFHLELRYRGDCLQSAVLNGRELDPARLCEKA